jgi:5-methyltetrahydrofolate--homocysteine methyltransferase
MKLTVSSAPRLDALRAILRERIVVLDGAFGTSVHELELHADDYGGEVFDGCIEHLVVTRPDLVRALHVSFLEAGADMIETNSFGSSPVVLAEFGLEDRARDLSRRAASIAREAADSFSTPSRPRFVIGAMGPTTRSISVSGGITYRELVDAYYEQACGLIEGGADVLLLETVQDTLNARAGLDAIDRAIADVGIAAGIAVQGTVEPMGTLLAGQNIESFYISLAHRDLLWIGLNCATGPDFMTEHLRRLAALSRFPVACVPNAGLPDEDGHYHEQPAILAAKLGRFMDEGLINLVGGCCGTRPEHIAQIAALARQKTPRRIVAAPKRSALCGLTALALDETPKPIIVGERTNSLGSRRFKRLIASGKLDEAVAIGREQLRHGARILDVCVQDPDRDETRDLAAFLDALVRQIKAPIMIDSTDPASIELALERIQGKAIINSVNLEDGGEAPRLVQTAALARRFGAAIVFGCIDEDREQAQAITRERKLAIAKRGVALLSSRFGIPPEDIYIDPLVFPVGTGDPTYAGSAVETIEGIRAIREALPQCRTVLGVSNVSFGLPEACRSLVNSVMLHHCVKAGLDLAIIDARAVADYAGLDPVERALAEDLLWARGDDPIGALVSHFRDRAPKPAPPPIAELPLDQRIARCVIDGSREGLERDLDLALVDRKPLEIINGPLMDGMAEVGRRFAANEMIVAEVLRSAEVMKAAVAQLTPHMERNASAVRGRIVLATVKGDVHDIGKTLVEIIFANNGYKVIDLGIKVPPEDLIRAYHEHQPDAIGLSGLLVKSARMMATTAAELRDAGIACPLLVGGAALSDRFTRTRIAPNYDGLVAYASDAMSGLDLLNQIMDHDKRRALTDRLEAATARMLEATAAAASSATPTAAPATSSINHSGPIPVPPDLKPHVLENYDLNEIFPFINPVMLYTRHLGLRDAERLLRDRDPRALRLRGLVEELQQMMVEREDIRAGAVFRFFPASSEDRKIRIFDPAGKVVLETLTFGRQSDAPGLCLADFIAPSSAHPVDYIGMFAVSIGPGVRALADEFKRQGEYLRSHALQAIALECAEAFAEMLHLKMREMWGIADPPGLTKKDLFQARYRGKRFSFGYPACPRLEDQAVLFRLLKPEQWIGVRLTDGFMMDPEASVSALVIHHPQARYFALSEQDTERLVEELDSASPQPADAA